MISIDTNKRLPPELRVGSAGSHLYGIGLSLYPFGDQKRHSVYKPLLVFAITIHIFVRNIIPQIMQQMDQKVYLFIGDFAYFTGVPLHLNMTVSLIVFISMLSQCLNYYNYKRGIKPNDLNVFRMLSGYISPNSIGIGDRLLVQRLLKTTKIVFKMANIGLNAMPVIVIAVFSLSFLTKVSPIEFWLIVIPHSLVYGISGYYIFAIIIWQFAYYYIITKYLTLKASSINSNLRAVLNTPGKRKHPVYYVSQVCRQLDAIYREIHEYDRNYWSKFLAIIWLTISFIVSLMCFITLYSRTNIVFKIFFIIAELLFVSILLFLIQITSQIHIECNKSNRLLNTLYLLSSQRHTPHLTLRVCFLMCLI